MISIESIGAIAVKNLRTKKLQSGLPFMINDSDLLPGQCYLEFPDGIIMLAALDRISRDLVIISELTENEATMMRLKYGLAIPF